ncbi:hypothetical protein B0J13DRAFT_519093 [Dactylonectria estremocensis]|uniref:Uncharacterized protein n=1 Tax=Dactylonectria estremocensis TaxID=1079267 RepID=A0A9P9JFG3_9HYPO|nr:hypothetical protein B0J13DRAFT_519093 [Dactylonectria estremocensis]
MSRADQPVCRSIELEPGAFPEPATRLVVTQHLRVYRDPFFWAYIIVAAFFDEEDNVLWSTEIFLVQLDHEVELDSDDESTQVDSESDSDDEGTGSSARGPGLRQNHDSVSIDDNSDLRSPAHLEHDFVYPHNSEISYGAHGSHDQQQPISHQHLWQFPLNYSITPPTYWDPIRQGPLHGHWEAAGWNSVTGRDATGTCPPYAPPGAPMPTHGQPYIHQIGAPGFTFSPVAPPQYYAGYGGLMIPPSPYTLQPAPPYSFPVQGGIGGFQTQQVFSQQPNGTGNFLPRQPQPCPVIDPEMPAAQMTNSSGGVGCEPGYNYFFPASHTKVHVFKSNTSPWNLAPNAPIKFIAVHIPSNTKLGDLLKGYGCTNPIAKMNQCYELWSAGNGKWYSGINFAGDNKEMLKKTMEDVGWNDKRTGKPGEAPIVCLWFKKG